MSEPCRILYIWDADYPWDVRTEKVCATLTQAGHDVHIVARNRRWAPLLESLPEGSVHRMRPWRRLGRRLDSVLGFPAFVNPRWWSLIDRTIRDTKPDLLVVRDLPLCPLALREGKQHDIPVLFDMAENYPALLADIWASKRQGLFDLLIRNPRAAKAVERYAVARVNRVLVVIEEAADHLERLGVDRRRIHVVSNTPSRSRVTSVLPATRAVDVTYLGIMEIARGLMESIDALGHLARSGCPVRARFIGGGRDLELLRARADQQGLTPHQVEFTGYVEGHENALALLAQSRIGILPHHANEWASTTIPNKIFDYMAAGVAVLSSDAAPCARILVETGAGRTFPGGDSRALAEALDDMLMDTDRLDEYAAAGRQAVLDRYNWENDAAELLRAVTLTLTEPHH